MHIKELEGHAGLPLFERIGKKLFITEAGQELLTHARELLRSLKDAEDVLDGLKGLRRGRINLAVVSTAKYFIPRLLARFGKNYPQLEIRLAVNNRNSVIEQLIANEVDLAVMGRSPQSLDTIAEPFAQNPHVIIAAPDHPLAGRRRVTVEAVAKETFIVREPGSGTRLAMQQFFDERQVPCRVGLEMASNETIKQAVMAGMGVALLSLHTIGLELDHKLIATPECEGLPVMRRWHVVNNLAKTLSPAAEAFRYFILERGEAFLAKHFAHHRDFLPGR